MNITSSEREIIDGLRAANETAIRALYELHYRPLCYFAEKLLNNKEEAEDVAAETFLKLVKKKQDFDNLTNIKSFLFTAARNACFDILRKTKRTDKSKKELEYLAQPDELFGDDEMIKAKVLQKIYAEVERLPGQCRLVFKSIFIEGKNTAVIASELGISTQTVLNQKTKALRTLRLKIYDEGLYSTATIVYCLQLLILHRNL